MKLTKEDRDFLKRNKRFLEDLFERRIQELKENSATLDPNLTADEFKIKYLGYLNFINELETWLKTIRILAKETKSKSDTGV